MVHHLAAHAKHYNEMAERASPKAPLPIRNLSSRLMVMSFASMWNAALRKSSLTALPDVAPAVPAHSSGHLRLPAAAAHLPGPTHVAYVAGQAGVTCLRHMCMTSERA